MRTRLAALLVFWLTAQADAGLEPYQELIRRDKPASASADADVPREKLPQEGVRVTYLGTNGYLLEAAEGRVLIDPYFTRTPLWKVALNLRQQSSALQVDWALQRIAREIDVVLVTHGHFDHLLDVPAVCRHTGARLIASPTSVNLGRACGVSKHTAVLPGDKLTEGGIRIEVLHASHDHVLGRMPFPGVRTSVPSYPRHPSDWVCGEPLAFVIELGGKRIYVDSGGTSAILPPPQVRRIDLAIIGVALPDSRKRLPQVLQRLRPSYFLPSHQDDFFRPIQRGFTFGNLTDFPHVRDAARGHQLVLLDYFAPWTLQ